MTSKNIAKDAAAIAAETLLVHYSFDLGHGTAAELVTKWLEDYPAHWLRLAIVEALYQGRYKSVSVEQILVCWQRRSKAIYHFNLEFERLICAKLPGVYLEHREVDAEEFAVAPASQLIAENDDRVLTNNLPISPIVAQSQVEMSDRTESEITLHTEEISQSVLSPEPEADDRPQNILSENMPSDPNSNHGSTAETKNYKSDIETKRQIIIDLLDDPWLDDLDREIIDNLLQSETNSEIDSDLRDRENFNSSWPANRTQIHEFTPCADRSEFYTRLKAVLEHKLNHPEDSHRKRRYRKPR